MVLDIKMAVLLEMSSDDENESDKLINYYEICNQQERGVIDQVLMYLCGWSFNSLLQRAQRDGMYVEE